MVPVLPAFPKIFTIGQAYIRDLREAGELEGHPRDIGPLIREVRRDITEEEVDAIKAWLWGQFGRQLLRRSTAGLPEWYKDQLLEEVLPAA